MTINFKSVKFNLIFNPKNITIGEIEKQNNDKSLKLYINGSLIEDNVCVHLYFDFMRGQLSYHVQGRVAQYMKKYHPEIHQHEFYYIDNSGISKEEFEKRLDIIITMINEFIVKKKIYPRYIEEDLKIEYYHANTRSEHVKKFVGTVSFQDEIIHKVEYIIISSDTEYSLLTKLYKNINKKFKTNFTL